MYRDLKQENILIKDKGVQIYRILSFYSYSLIKYHNKKNYF